MIARTKTVFDLPVERLAGYFDAKAMQGSVHVPEPLFEQYLNLYSHARRLHDKLELVIHDESHAQLLEEGRSKFNLPPHDHLQTENAWLGKALSFNPYERNTGTSGMVQATLADIKGFFDVFARGKDVVNGMDAVYRDTDYIKFHRYRRDELGARYEGPKSFDEWVAVKYRLKTVSDACVQHARNIAGERPVGLFMGI